MWDIEEIIKEVETRESALQDDLYIDDYIPFTFDDVNEYYE